MMYIMNIFNPVLVVTKVGFFCLNYSTFFLQLEIVVSTTECNFFSQI